MTLEELLEKIGKARPGLKIPPKLAATVLRLAFKAIREELNGVDEGVVPVAGLGTFRVKRAVQMHEGGRVTRKVIVFRYRQDDRLPG